VIFKCIKRLFLINFNSKTCVISRVVGRSENPGVPVVMWGHTLPLLVEIGLTDLLKSGGAMAPPTPLGTTPLLRRYFFNK
jgi:hypothetical protein